MNMGWWSAALGQARSSLSSLSPLICAKSDCCLIELVCAQLRVQLSKIRILHTTCVMMLPATVVYFCPAFQQQPVQCEHGKHCSIWDRAKNYYIKCKLWHYWRKITNQHSSCCAVRWFQPQNLKRWLVCFFCHCSPDSLSCPYSSELGLCQGSQVVSDRRCTLCITLRSCYFSAHLFILPLLL